MCVPNGEGGGGELCRLIGWRVETVAANGDMQRGASRVGRCARVDFSGQFAAACVTKPARRCQVIDTSYDNSCLRRILKKQDAVFLVFKRFTAVQNIRRDPCMSVPVCHQVMGPSNHMNMTSVYRHTACNCKPPEAVTASPGSACFMGCMTFMFLKRNTNAWPADDHN